MRFTVFRLLLVVAIAAILLYFPSDWTRSRRERFLQVADWHARIGAEYQRNAGGAAIRWRIAGWHEHVSREFERAAARALGVPSLAASRSRPGDRRRPATGEVARR